MKIELRAHRRLVVAGWVLRCPAALARHLGQMARAWWAADPRDEAAAAAPIGLAVAIAAVIIVGSGLAAVAGR